MLLRRIRVPFCGQDLQTVDQSLPSVAGLDDVIDVAPRGSDIRMGEFLAVFVDKLGFPPLWVFRFRDLLAKDDANRTIRAHHSQFSAWPGDVHVTTYVFGGHNVISPAIGFTCDNGYLWDGGFAICIEELSAVSDDTAVLLCCAG